jgi:hypothetical protein
MYQKEELVEGDICRREGPLADLAEYPGEEYLEDEHLKAVPSRGKRGMSEFNASADRNGRCMPGPW